MIEFQIGPFKWQYRFAEEGITISSTGFNKHLYWADITGAGISPKGRTGRPVTIPTDSDILPGLDKLAGVARRMEDATELLLIAHRAGGEKKRLLTLNIPAHGENRDAILNELSGRLGDRWLGDGIDQLRLRRTPGISNWWLGPAAAAAVAVVSAALSGWWYLQDKFWIPVAIVTGLVCIGSRLKKREDTLW